MGFVGGKSQFLSGICLYCHRVFRALPFTPPVDHNGGVKVGEFSMVTSETCSDGNDRYCIVSAMTCTTLAANAVRVSTTQKSLITVVCSPATRPQPCAVVAAMNLYTMSFVLVLRNSCSNSCSFSRDTVISLEPDFEGWLEVEPWGVPGRAMSLKHTGATIS
jgi:hypothetical protein